MTSKNITDMTQGNPTKHLLLFALPTLIGNIFQQIYNLADSIIVGRFVGANAFAATNKIEQLIHQPYTTLGAIGLRITSLFYLALGMIYVIRGILTGIGDAFFSLFNGIVEVIGRFTIPALFCSYLGFGEAGIWISSGVVWLISGVTAWIRYLTYFRSKISIETGTSI